MPFDSIPDAQVTARDRLIRLRDFLAELPAERFDMSKWRGCGTPSCIGGWAQRLYHTRGEIGTWEALGLSETAAMDLLFPGATVYLHPTPTQAVRVLDHLLATSSPGTCDGVVDWGRMGEP